METERDTNAIENMKPFYVYELRDPRDNSVFYVGKGKNERSKQHEIETLGSTEEKARLQRIREIRTAKKEITIIVIGRFDSAEEALVVESVLIEWVYGIRNLTNEIRGHNHRDIRALGDFMEIPGLDMPRRSYLLDGVYSENVLREIRQNHVREDLEVL